MYLSMSVSCLLTIVDCCSNTQNNVANPGKDSCLHCKDAFMFVIKVVVCNSYILFTN